MVTKKRAGAISKKLALKGKASLAKAWGGGLEQPLSSLVSLKIISVSSSTLARRGCWLDVDLSFCSLTDLAVQDAAAALQQPLHPQDGQQLQVEDQSSLLAKCGRL